jgi:putative hydrolase of the HAD superfamily
VSLDAPFPTPPHTVTFDCWATLIVEVDGFKGPRQRAKLVAEAAGVSESRAAEALKKAWQEHQVFWHRGVVFGADDITGHALDALGVPLDPARRTALAAACANVARGHEVRAFKGARETLSRLADRGIRRALVCDTGFSPGTVVRELLASVGLLELLEVTVFSNEVGVPKPHPAAFQAALDGLGVPARGAVHVGDLRRSDIAGARAMGMGSIRIKVHNDDKDEVRVSNAGVIDCVAAGCTPACARPEADRLASTYAEVQALLGVR